MKKDNNSSMQQNRRNFLTKAVAVSGGAAIVAASTSVQADQPETLIPENDKPSSGYQETAHVRAYYKSLSA